MNMAPSMQIRVKTKDSFHGFIYHRTNLANLDYTGLYLDIESSCWWNILRVLNCKLGHEVEFLSLMYKKPHPNDHPLEGQNLGHKNRLMPERCLEVVRKS